MTQLAEAKKGGLGKSLSCYIFKTVRTKEFATNFFFVCVHSTYRWLYNMKEQNLRGSPDTQWFIWHQTMVDTSAVVDTTFVDIYVDTKNIPTCWYDIQHINKRTFGNKMSIIMWEAAMSYIHASTFQSKNVTSLGPKRRIITNWEPYFVVYFQITLVSHRRRHSSVLVNKSRAFYVNELSINPCMCYIIYRTPPLWPNGTFPFHAT